MAKETWKPIPGYEGLYEVSSVGRVKNLGKHYRTNINGKMKLIHRDPRITTLRYDSDGYLKASLTKENKMKVFFVHRLVALAFIPQIEGKPQVNHINGIKDDNRVENLEWCTSKENTIHAHKNNLCGIVTKARRVAQLDDEKRIIAVYESARKAELQFTNGRESCNISCVCRRGYGRMYGFRWKYLNCEEYDECLKQFKSGKKYAVINRKWDPEPFFNHSTNGVPVAQMDDDGNIINMFPNSIKAAIAIGKKSQNGRAIRRICMNGTGHHAGYRWKWVSCDEYDAYINQ